MPIMGIEDLSANKEQERERIREHQADGRGRDAGLRGTVMELSGNGPDFAPYKADPEWGSLSARLEPGPKAVKKPAMKPKPVQKTANTQLVGAGPRAFQWQAQFDQFWSKLKAMLKIK